MNKKADTPAVVHPKRRPAVVRPKPYHVACAVWSWSTVHFNHTTLSSMNNKTVATVNEHPNALSTLYVRSCLLLQRSFSSIIYLHVFNLLLINKHILITNCLDTLRRIVENEEVYNEYIIKYRMFRQYTTT